VATETSTASQQEKKTLQDNIWKSIAASGRGLYYLTIIIAFLVLTAPVFIIAAISFTSTQSETLPPDGFSLRWYEAFLQNGDFVAAFFEVSLPIAVVVAVISTTLGGLAAYGLSKAQFRGKSFVRSFLLSPLMIPHIIIGLSLLLFFAQANISNPFGSLIAGHVIITIPYTTLTATTSLQNLDGSLEEAARNLGASRAQAFLYVTLPLIKSGLIAGLLFSFIISFSDVNVALFLTGQDAVTLPVEIFLFLRWESSPIIAAISTVQIALIMVLIILIDRLIGFESALNY